MNLGGYVIVPWRVPFFPTRVKRPKPPGWSQQVVKSNDVLFFTKMPETIQVWELFRKICPVLSKSFNFESSPQTYQKSIKL